MNSTERRRPITRRKRLAHLGVGGVMAAAATVATPVALTPAEPAAASAAAPGVKRMPAPKVRRPATHETSRSQGRQPLPAVWDAIVRCEAGGDWSIDTGNGFLWGAQFTPGTFDAYRGHLPTAEAYLASGRVPTPAQQVAVAERILAAQGWGAWPVCSQKLGLR